MKQTDIASKKKSEEPLWFVQTVKIYFRLGCFQYKSFFQSWSPIVPLSGPTKRSRAYHRLDSISHMRLYLDSNNKKSEIIY